MLNSQGTSFPFCMIYVYDRINVDELMKKVKQQANRKASFTVNSLDATPLNQSSSLDRYAK